MFAKERNFAFEKGDANLCFDEKYLKIRSELVSIIIMMIEKLKFGQQTFYQAILYMDILLFKNRKYANDELKIVAVSCLILAGIFVSFYINFINLLFIYLFILIPLVLYLIFYSII